MILSWCSKRHVSWSVSGNYDDNHDDDDAEGEDDDRHTGLEDDCDAYVACSNFNWCLVACNARLPALGVPHCQLVW